MELLAGVYEAIVVSHHWITARTGTTGLQVVISVVDQWGEEHEMTGTIYMSKKSMGMARAQLKALGFDPDHQELAELGYEISLSGNPCQAELAEEEYNGRKSLKVKWFGKHLPPPSKEQLAETQKALQAAKHSQTESEIEESAPAPSPASARSPPSSNVITNEEAKQVAEQAKENGDDIPF